MTWASAPLDSVKSGDRYSFVGGPFGSELTTRDYVAEGVPVIRGNNLAGQSKFVDDDFVFVSEQKAASLHSNMAYPGDLVFTQRGTLGQVGLIPKDARFSRYVVSQSQMKLTVDEEKAVPLFIYYNFRLPSTIQKILNRVSSSGVPHINLSTLKAFEVPLPPPTIQKSIVDIAEKYDALIENNRRRIHLLEDAARLFYREWFVHFRFPGHEHTKIIDGVPDGWQRTPFGNAVEFLSRGITPTYDDEATGIVINQKCIRNGRLDLSLARRQSRAVPEPKLVRRGDVLINSTGEGTLGRVAQVGQEIAACTVDSHVTIARPKPGVGPYYFGMSLKLLEGYISGLGRGATNQTELSRNSIAELKLIQPSREFLKEYEERACTIETEISVLSAQNEKLGTARDLLLPKMMSGEVEV